MPDVSCHMILDIFLKMSFHFQVLNAGQEHSASLAKQMTHSTATQAKGYRLVSSMKASRESVGVIRVVMTGADGPSSGPGPDVTDPLARPEHNILPLDSNIIPPSPTSPAASSGPGPDVPETLARPEHNTLPLDSPSPTSPAP